MIHQPPPRIEKYDVVTILRTRKPARVELVEDDIVIVSIAKPDHMDRSRSKAIPDLEAYRPWELSVMLKAEDMREDDLPRGRPQRAGPDAELHRAYKRIMHAQNRKAKAAA